MAPPFVAHIIAWKQCSFHYDGLCIHNIICTQILGAYIIIIIIIINTVLLLYHAQFFYLLLESNNVTYVQGKQYIQYSISPQNIRGVWIQRKIFFQRYYILKMWIFFYFGTCWETNKKLKNTTEANKNI